MLNDKKVSKVSIDDMNTKKHAKNHHKKAKNVDYGGYTVAIGQQAEYHGFRRHGDSPRSDVQNYHERSHEKELVKMLTNTSHHEMYTADTRNYDESHKHNYDHVDQYYYIANDRLYELVKKGIVSYKNGSYYINDERVFDYVIEENKKRKKELRDKIIEEETDKIYKDKLGKKAIQSNPLLRKIIKRKISKKFDRKELKSMKKEYKLNKKVRRWERKYGKLSKQIF